MLFQVILFIGCFTACFESVESIDAENQLASLIANTNSPPVALYKIWSETVTINPTATPFNGSPTDLLNEGQSCTQADANIQFIKLCHQLGIETRLVNIKGREAYDFGVDDEWVFIDLETGSSCLKLDNQSFASSEEMMDDPFLKLRMKNDRTASHVDFKKGWESLAAFEMITPYSADCFKSDPRPAVKNDSSLSKLQKKFEEQKATAVKVSIINQDPHFHYISPSFHLANTGVDKAEKIWWQISSDPDFKFVASNLEQERSYTDTITLPLISETFINGDETYYFRVKGSRQGVWGAWSSPYAFKTTKPDQVIEVEFEKKGDNSYELDWERYADVEDSSIEYMVFGSNSLDFIPSVYCDMQVNALADGQVTHQEANDNLIAVTREPKIKISGSLAYYRIIAKKNGQLSVPSPILRVYDHDLIQPRNVLQLSENGEIKRVLFPASYSSSETSLPYFPSRSFTAQNSLIDLQRELLDTMHPTTHLRAQHPISRHEHIPEDVWERVKPYLIPENHPAKAKLDRIFSKRVTLNPDTFRRAGFRRYRPGRFSRIMASAHPELRGYFIKAFSDMELGIKSDANKFIHRIKGAAAIRECIAKHGYEKIFKVPNKWIYPLPAHPSPPKGEHYLRKNFILVAEDMQIYEQDKNKTKYHKDMTKPLIKALFTVFQEVGLFDSVYAFNVPFCKDGKIAFIDTEYHHRWPVPYQKMDRYLTGDIKKYWQHLYKSAPANPNGLE